MVILDKRVTIRLSEKLRKDLRVAAGKLDMGMSDYIVQSLKKCIKDEVKLNRNTYRRGRSNG